MSSNYPTPTRPSRSMSMQVDENFDANQRTLREKRRFSETKQAKKFRSKVLKAVEGEKVSGRYISSFFISLSSKTINEWTTFEKGDLGTITNFFQPLQFKDAEGICFFGKVAEDATAVAPNDGWGTETNNNDKLATVRVLDSNVYMNFKSNSSMRMIVEIYEIQGDKNQPSTANDKNFIVNPGAPGTNIQTVPTVTGLHSTLSQQTALLQDFKIKRTVIKFNPGEEAQHFIQGPKNYEMHSSNKILQDGTWANWTYPNSGIHVMFRVISDINMAYYVEGAGAGAYINQNLSPFAFNISHYPNTIDFTGGAGTVNCEITRNYTIGQPEGSSIITIPGIPPTVNIANFEPACVIYNNLPVMVAGYFVQTVVPGSGTAGDDAPRD